MASGLRDCFLIVLTVNLKLIEVFSEKQKEFTMNQSIQKTVGQYTGLKDSTGKRILRGTLSATMIQRKNIERDKVRFQDGYFCIFIKGVPCEYITLDSLFRNHDAEVIGNRWDNPELLVAE